MLRLVLAILIFSVPFYGLVTYVQAIYAEIGEILLAIEKPFLKYFFLFMRTSFVSAKMYSGI